MPGHPTDQTKPERRRLRSNKDNIPPRELSTNFEPAHNSTELPELRPKNSLRRSPPPEPQPNEEIDWDLATKLASQLDSHTPPLLNTLKEIPGPAVNQEVLAANPDRQIQPENNEQKQQEHSSTFTPVVQEDQSNTQTEMAANTTINEALHAAKKAAVPQFISPPTKYKDNMDFNEFLSFFEKGLKEDNFHQYYWLTSSPNKPPASMKELKDLMTTIDKAPPIHRSPLHRPQWNAFINRSPFPRPSYRYPSRYNYYQSNPIPRRQPTNYPQHIRTFTSQTQNSQPRAPFQRNSQPQYQGRNNVSNYYPTTRSQPHTNQRQFFNNRTIDNRPRCLRCNRPGHFAISCRSPPNRSYTQHPNARGRQN
jgi:hypothetical protein